MECLRSARNARRARDFALASTSNRNGCRKEPRDANTTSRIGITDSGPAAAELCLGAAAGSRAPPLAEKNTSGARTGRGPAAVWESLLWNRARCDEVWL